MIIQEKQFNQELLDNLKNGIFIYPTDTIYGIGCDATNSELVEKIREIKGRDQKPFSVIAPSVDWILNNFKVDKELIEKYLPGPYTLLLEKKNAEFLKSVSDNEFVGVRIPDCEFTGILQSLEIPIITTSVNLSGEEPANKVDEIGEDIKNKVDLIVDAEELSGKPSVLIKNGKEVNR